MTCRGCASQFLLPSPPSTEQRLCCVCDKDPDGSFLAVPASSCSTGTEAGGPDAPSFGEGTRTPTCPSFECCRTHLFFRYHSNVPCKRAPGWESSLGLCQHCLGAGHCLGLLCHGSQAALEQLAPARHCGGWEGAGIRRSSALSHGGRGTQTCVKEELVRGASAPRPSRAFLSLFLFTLLFLHKRNFCGHQGGAIGRSHGREDEDHGGPTLAYKDFLVFFSHGICLLCLRNFPQVLFHSLLTLVTVSWQVRVTAGTIPAQQPACLACHAGATRLEPAVDPSYKTIC